MEKQKKQTVIIKSLVVNEKGEILFVRRKREWHKEAHNKWEFPGGKIDFGKNPEETARREVKEESGYDVEVSYLLPKLASYVWDFEDACNQLLLICYVCRLKGGKKILADHGVSEIKWFQEKAALKLDCLPGVIEFLKIYIKNKKK